MKFPVRKDLSFEKKVKIIPGEYFSEIIEAKTPDGYAEDSAVQLTYALRTEPDGEVVAKKSEIMPLTSDRWYDFQDKLLERYYGCPNHEKKICPVTEIRADYVEKFVAYTICLNLINLENVELYKGIIKKFDSNKSLVDKIKGKEKAIENVMAAIERSSNDLLVDRLEVLIEEKIELENKLNQKIGDIASNKESLKSVRKKVQKDLRYKTDIEISNFLKTVITSAEVGMNGFNLTIAA